MAFPTLTFANLDDWMNWINDNIVPNGMELITGDDGNITENAAVKFIKQSPLNWQTARIESLGGVIVAQRPVNVFMTTVPTSLTWNDNIYNQYIFINTTLGDIPTVITYYDVSLASVNIIPARSIVNIIKASNNNWIVASVPSSGSVASFPPYVGVVDGGNPNDPVSGTPIFQNNSLKGLGSTNSGKIQITYAEIVRSSFGQNQSFIYNSVTGTIDLNYNSSGEEFNPDSTLWVNRNQ
jgi:hypothetical protein